MSVSLGGRVKAEEIIFNKISFRALDDLEKKHWKKRKKRKVLFKIIKITK